MRTTLTLDDERLVQAEAFTGPHQKSALIQATQYLFIFQ